MSTRKIQRHLRELRGVEVCADLIGAITDAVLEKMADRPLDTLHP